MRFRKRVKIAKGISLNFSTSGTSLTLGGRGASVNIGKRGTYLNTGIPGSGFYDRTKISGSNKKPSNYSTGNDKSTSKQSYDISYNIELDEKGKPLLTDSFGRKIIDEGIIRKIKSTQHFKNLLKIKQGIKQKDVEKSTSDFINIYKLSPPVISASVIVEELSNLKVQHYVKKTFNEVAPTLGDVKAQLIVEAKEKIKSILFWNTKSKREKYVNEKIEGEFKKALTDYELKKNEFIQLEATNEKSKNEDLLNSYNYEKSVLDKFLNASTKDIEDEIIDILSDIVLPADFSIDFEYNHDSKTLSIDLDLPEVEDLPKTKVNTLASGGISIKDKTQKELKSDYATCVVGMAFFFASTFFNISSNIENISISGYTQRVNKKNGNIEDEYIYSIIFERRIMGNMNIQNIDPIEAIKNFTHKIQLSINYDMRTIEPLSSIDEG